MLAQEIPVAELMEEKKEQFESWLGVVVVWIAWKGIYE